MKLEVFFYFLVLFYTFFYFVKLFKDIKKGLNINDSIQQDSKTLIKVGFLVLGFLLINFTIAVLIWLSEYFHDQAIKSGVIDEDVMKMVLWIFKDLVGIADKRITFESNLSVLWFGVLKLGYGLGTAIMLTKFGGYIWAKWENRKMNDTVLLYGNSDLISTIKDEFNEQNQISRQMSHTPSPNGEGTGYSLEDFCDYIFDPDQDHISKVIIFSDLQLAKKAKFDDVDLWSVCMAHKLKKVSEGKRQIHFVFEVKSAKVKSIIKEDIGYDVICIKNFGAELLAHSLISPMIIDVFERLLRSSNHTNEIYIKPLQNFLFVKNNKTQKKLTYSSLNSGIKEVISSKEILPIGFVSPDNSIELNPSDNDFVPLGSSLIFLSTNNPKKLKVFV